MVDLFARGDYHTLAESALRAISNQQARSNKNDKREIPRKDRAGKTNAPIGGQLGRGEGQRGKNEGDSCNPALRELWMLGGLKSRDDLHLGEGGDKHTGGNAGSGIV